MRGVRRAQRAAGPGRAAARTVPAVGSGAECTSAGVLDVAMPHAGLPAAPRRWTDRRSSIEAHNDMLFKVVVDAVQATFPTAPKVVAAALGSWQPAALLFAKAVALLKPEAPAFSLPAREHYKRAHVRAKEALGDPAQTAASLVQHSPWSRL
jgi:hypothetical protein